MTKDKERREVGKKARKRELKKGFKRGKGTAKKRERLGGKCRVKERRQSSRFKFTDESLIPTSLSLPTLSTSQSSQSSSSSLFSSLFSSLLLSSSSSKLFPPQKVLSAEEVVAAKSVKKFPGSC